MIAGTVQIADDGTFVAGTHLADTMATALYDSFVNNYEADAGVAMPLEQQQRVPILRGYATVATRMAAIVPYLTTNAQGKITNADGGLQRDADGANPDCLAPTVDKFISIV